MYSKTGQPHHQHHHHHHHHHEQNRQNAVVALSPEAAKANEIFDLFVAASTFKSVLHHYRNICDLLHMRPANIRHFYPKLRNKIRSWKAQAIWNKIDKRATHKCYNHGKIAANTKVLIIGCGPCGLRTAIEAQLLGAKVVVVEKRDRFSRNNVLHLWPFVITDLKALAAKKFYGKFCAGAIDHISIRQLQCILLKVALLLGVEVYEGVSFESVIEPPDDEDGRTGWSAQFSPPEHPVNQYEFDVLVGADGKRNTLNGFKRKEFRGKLAIAITANFINKHTEDDARVEEISGVAFIFNQKFFKDLYAETGIDLENIVYYKDETHYFVMTAKKHSLLDKGVILQDLPDTQQLLHSSNVDRNALYRYAKEAADFSTNYRLPNVDFAVNHYGQPDVAMFDFTSMFAAENACRILEKKGHKLLMCLVGDSLLEPFWPTGSGCARGFLSAFDAAWCIRSFSMARLSPLEVIAERESIYRLLAQTTPQNLAKDHLAYSLDPASRYPHINLQAVLPFQVRNLFNTDDPLGAQQSIDTEAVLSSEDQTKKRKRIDSIVHPETLLNWCKKQVALYPDIHVDDMTTSFKDGRVLCAIIHRYRPDLIDFNHLVPENVAQNNQLAYDILEREFCVPPVITGAEMSECEVPDKLSMISYLSQVHDVFRGVIPHVVHPRMDADDIEKELNYKKSKVSRAPGNILKSLASSENNTNSSRLDKNIDIRGDAGRKTCRLLDDESLSERKSDSLKKNKKRRSDRVLSPLDKYDQLKESHSSKKAVGAEPIQDFSDRVKGLEAKFTHSSHANDKKPKDMIRAIGKIEKSDWNMAALEKKIDDSSKSDSRHEKHKVPSWNKDSYEDKFHNIERRLRENGEDEATIAKYRDIDASLQRLEKKLKEGSTLETGLRGSNKVSNLASQLSSKLERKVEEKTIAVKQTVRPVVPMPTSGSDLCHFCGTRVYLVERLSTEGKFFHRQCFKCDYCGALLRLGNYIYDREGRFGGKFFCIPHFGLAPKARNRRKIDTSDSLKENKVPSLNKNNTQTPITSGKTHKSPEPVLQTPPNRHISDKDGLVLTSPIIQSLKDADGPIGSLDLRGATPERVEFENSVVEKSDDEDEYLSEDEWTDRNFGASANELDDAESDDNSDYSDLGDEEADDEEVPFETERSFTAAETRQMAESWRRRYSIDDFESDLDSDGSVHEYNAEEDESHAGTEGELDMAGVNDIFDDDDENEGENRRARELRRMELNINVDAPPYSETSDSSDDGSETEIASDDESDTQIDTDSEFADDNVPKEIPTIVIDESQATQSDGESKENESKEKEVKIVNTGEKGRWTHRDVTSTPKEEYVRQRVDISSNMTSDNWLDDEAEEKSASLTNLNKISNKPNPHTEHLKRLLERTESAEAIAAQRNLQLRRQYLLGGTSNAPRKSVSTADLGNRFKSFMDKISATQKMLNPAPQPSPAMQAFMNTTVSKSPMLSPSAPHLVEKDLSLAKEGKGNESAISDKLLKEEQKVTDKADNLNKDGANSRRSSSDQLEEGSSENSKSEDIGKFYSFPIQNSIEQKEKEPIITNNLDLDKDVESSDSSESSESNYDNVSSSARNSFIHKPIKSGDIEQYDNVINDFDKLTRSVKNNETNCDKNLEFFSSEQPNDFGETTLDNDLNPELSYSKIETIETINPELVSVNNLELKDNPIEVNVTTCDKTLFIDTLDKNKTVSNDKLDNSFTITSDLEDQFEKLANDAILDPITKPEITNELVSSDNQNDISKTPLEMKISSDSDNHSSKTNLDDSSIKTITPYSCLTDNESTVNSVCDTMFDDVSIKSDCTIQVTEEKKIENIEKIDNTKPNTVNIDSKLDENLTNLTPIKNIPRMASIESLGDTDSAISTAPSRTTSNTVSKPSVLKELENIEFMDTSESASSPEDADKYAYRKLEEETPTTPSEPKLITCSSPESKSTDSELSKTSSSSNEVKYKDEPIINEASNSLVSLPNNNNFDEKKDKNEPKGIFKSISYSDKTITKSPEKNESFELFSSPKRYEGYIPRFKDRSSPLDYNKDSFGISKSSSQKVLFSNSFEENSPNKKSIDDNSIEEKSSKSSPTTKKAGGTSCYKDGDLIAALVRSRINRKSPDKITRKTSRSNIGLSSSNSKSSLINSQSSQENLLEKLDVSDINCDNTNSETLIKNNLKNSKLNLSIEKAEKEAKANLQEPTNSLPATPLTHPEKFTNDANNDFTFKTPISTKSISQNIRPRAYSASLASRPDAYNNLNSADRSKSREMAREKAKLKTDMDLGLSPPYLVNSLRNRLKQNSFSETETDKEDQSTGTNNHSVTNGSSKTSNCSTNNQVTLRNKDERVKELLAEHRLREGDSSLDISSHEKEDRVRERLEEYRQKRASSCGIESSNLRHTPDKTTSSISESTSGIIRKRSHRPSLLELESMQVFITSNDGCEKFNVCRKSPSAAAILDSTANSINAISTPANTSNSNLMSVSLTEPSPRLAKSPEVVANEESRPVKKSKDRERRRSLIQVFTGMFSKSDERKKSQDNLDVSSNSSENVTSKFVQNEPFRQLPKSPRGVKDKLSRLRMSRSKQKNKTEKNRSSSADILENRGSTDDLRSPISLPTSPTHHLSPQGSSSNNSPPFASEESLSDEEYNKENQKETKDKNSVVPPVVGNISTSNGRKQKANNKALKQAELKRLRMAQEIQRQLEECEVKTRELEEKGVAVEKSLRGEHDGVLRDEAELMSEWFSLVHEKNALVRWEQELMVRAKELELEDRHVRLESELRGRMAQSETEKCRDDIDREGVILSDMLNIMEQKDALYTMLEEDRQRYLEEDKDLASVMKRKGLQLSPLRKETGV